MRKRITMAVATVAVAAFASLAVPASASAAGFGEQIKEGCGASYGQLISAARAIGHIDGAVGGARNWVEAGFGTVHGCS